MTVGVLMSCMSWRPVLDAALSRSKQVTDNRQPPLSVPSPSGKGTDWGACLAIF